MFDTVLIDTVTRLLLFNVFGSYFNGRVLVRGLRSSKRRASWRLGPLTVSLCPTLEVSPFNIYTSTRSTFTISTIIHSWVKYFRNQEQLIREG